MLASKTKEKNQQHQNIIMIEFDFERDVEKMLPKVIRDELGFKLDQKQRTIVCRHWLLGLCYKGEQCSHLHRLDKSKMPPCKHGDMCKIKNCPLKHVAEGELEECTFYKQGFCFHGPKCGRRHVRRTPEECPLEAEFDATGGAGMVGGGKKLKTAQPNDNFKVTLCTHWLLNGSCPFNNDCHFAHGEDQINEGFQPNAEFLNDSDVYDPTAGKMDVPLQLPFPAASKVSYFILQSPDLRSLAISKHRGVWAVPMRMAAEINAAVRSSEHVILYMCVRPLRGIYGICRLAGIIPPMPQLGPAMSAEFPITWIRTLRLSLCTIAQLKLGATGMFVGRSAADGRFDTKVGLDIMLTAYRKPEWDWCASKEAFEMAERNIRTVDPHKGATAGDLGEYYPSGSAPTSALSAEVLFSQEWIDRAGLVPNEKGGFYNANKGGGGFSSAPAAAPLPPVPDFYTGTLPGFVFCAITPVIEEMLGRQLLGLPIQLKDVVIHPNVPLFIFDSMAQMILGIFHADSPTKLNIDHAAFVQWLGMGPQGGSPLPVQLKFRVAIEVPPTPVQDPEVLQALGGYATTLGGVLGVTETKNLANLLAKRVLTSQMLVAQARGLVKPPSAGTTSGSGMYYQPPFRCVDTVPVDIKGNLYDIKRKLLGNNASTIIKIVDELGSKHTIRVRIRGQGSGFLEGPQNVEFAQPLHFNISAENEQLLAAVVGRIKLLVDQVRNETPSF